MKKATIYDVASLAGVSIKTVSRVVNKEEGIRPGTREKVQVAIRALHYSPNTAARGLAASHAFLVGLLYDNPNAHYIIDVQNGVLDTCREEGFDLVIHPCRFEAPSFVEDVLRMYQSSRLAGLVLTPPLCDDTVFTRRLLEEGIPFVRIAPSSGDDSSPSVCCDDEQATHALTRHLLALGHRRLAMIQGHPGHGVSELRRRGFRRALTEQGLSVPANHEPQGFFDFDSGRACAAELLALEMPPTAIIACNDDMAAGVLVAAHSRGLSVPGDLSVVGFDDAIVARQSWPGLTTVRQPIRAMAEQAAAMLIDGVRGKPQQARHVHFHCELVIRDSTAAPA